MGLIPNTTSTDSTGGGECAAGSQPRVAWPCSVQTCHSRGYLLTKTPGQLWKGRDLATLQRAFPFGHVGAYLGAPRPAVPLGGLAFKAAMTPGCQLPQKGSSLPRRQVRGIRPGAGHSAMLGKRKIAFCLAHSFLSTDRRRCPLRCGHKNFLTHAGLSGCSERGLITTGGVAFKGWPMDCLSNTLQLSSVLFPQAPQGWAPAQSVWWPLSKAFRRLWQGSRTVFPPRITNRLGGCSSQVRQLR